MLWRSFLDTDTDFDPERLFNWNVFVTIAITGPINPYLDKKNRGILFNMDDKIPVKELKTCIALALTYHHNKKLKQADRWKMAEESI